MTRPEITTAEDSIDGLLRDFFGGELPKRWPAPEALVTSAAISNRRFVPPGRFALAASLLMMLAGSWWLAGHFTAPSGSILDGAQPTLEEAARRDVDGNLRRPVSDRSKPSSAERPAQPELSRPTALPSDRR
jgi:hypothetical protein